MTLYVFALAAALFSVSASVFGLRVANIPMHGQLGNLDFAMRRYNQSCFLNPNNFRANCASGE